jgi:hypothetical protein
MAATLALSASAQLFPFSFMRSAAGGGGGPTYLLQENFEGSGYENTWTEAGTGTKDEDYATSPAPLVGSQSLRLAFASQNGTTTTALSADQGTCDVYFQVNFAAIPASGKVFLRLRDASANTLVRIEIGSSNRFTLRHGTAAASTTDGLSTSTTYHVWISYAKGTGANGSATIAFSTTGTRPTSGNAYAAVTTGTATADVHDIMLGTENTSTWEGVFDKVRVDDATIGDNPS